jgi:glycerol-3-phosphate acyltransferase PlsX
MRIAVDAMGGDYAPAAIVEGAALAARTFGVPVALVGDEATVRGELAKHDAAADLVSVVHASEVIEMHESPSAALRCKQDASMLVAARMVAAGEADAVVSAGNSGAFMGAALLALGTIGGVSRPAIATLLPSKQGSVLLLDAGANCDCRAKHLVEFAHMGDVYARRVMRLSDPRVALLNIGEESTKGNELTKRAYKSLGATGLNFVGNVEGNNMLTGVADVVVSDGFVGNIVLKLGEGWADLFVTLLKQEVALLPSAIRDSESFLSALQDLRRRLDYSEYGGALLLGIEGVVVISHGRSTPKALCAAIGVAKEAVENQVVEGVTSFFRDRNLAAQVETQTAEQEEPFNA